MKFKNANGFSIVEMIVVIAIIGVLAAIILPSLKSARMRANKTQELALISHTGKAWVMYTGDHQGKLLPGYLSNEVQKYRKLAWAFPDESIVPPAPEYNSEISNIAGPWPWRLLSYMNNDWNSLLFYKEVEWESNGGQLTQHANEIATEPAFGYNGFYLGGWWEIDNHSSKPKMLFKSVTLTDGRVENVVATFDSQIQKSSKQIVFCSTFFANKGVYEEMQNNTAGTYIAIPSVFARVVKWKPLGHNRIEARFDTTIPLGRFNGMPAICNADGSTMNVELETLTDQSLWISKAQKIDDIPASKFSHTQ
ncbi:MAG TPA: type II secretion system protein [Phycisphaerales bacterium]|nr:type II secretion system protein [Phycisphaerales bacterium]HIB01266.1 type II secretion system protein [Phycisphaerales bacterium]HIB51227.1 type II secretion system protein [Phycisphaerales bacterium]HIN83579.1 type II secretion system protein [Phycisphaerales bacterium]HIO20497.1 type II secretion system protein [Phycisphaerales bacterium]